MDARLVNIKLLSRLNKLASGDYDNIECFYKVESVNKAQLEWVRRQIHGINISKEGDEESLQRVDDLQFLLKNKPLNTSNKEDLYVESEQLPEDYGWFKSVYIYGSTEDCKEQLMTDVHQIEEGNALEWLSDWSKSPSFEFRQCFYTLSGNRVKVYTNNEFTVSKLELVYYRKPKEFSLEDCQNLDGEITKSSDLEFKDDVCELIIDEAVSILAADIEHISAYQTSSKRKEDNN
jgi:hypothetical protein